MISITGYVTNLVLKSMKSFSEKDYLLQREENAKRAVPKLPKNLHVEKIDLNGMESEIISKENNKDLIFYIHGGGFTGGDAKERRIVTYYLVNKCGYNCVSINYRLAPENKWPSQIEDCLKAYENILKKYDSKDIIFMGESAGGTLVLSLGLLIKDKGLPMPKAIVAFSPATDQYEKLPSHTNNIKTDYMLRDAIAKGIAEPLFVNKPTKEELTHYLLSPYYGDYNDIPPIHLSASSSEVLYDDAIVLYEKLKQENHNVRLDVKKGVCHAYQIMTYMKEAKETLKDVFTFIDNL